MAVYIQSKTIEVQRVVTVSYLVTWPKDFPDMSLEEALAYEQNMDVPDVIELMEGSEHVDCSVTVKVID